MKIRNIFLILFLLLASTSYSMDSESRGFETSSEIELNQELATFASSLVTIQNPEINVFNMEAIQIFELNSPAEVLIVLKHPNSSVVFYSFEIPIMGYHNLKDLFVYSQIDKYLTMG